MLRVLKYWVKDDDSLSEKTTFPCLVLTCLYFNIRSFMTEYTSSCINYFVFGVVVIFLCLKFKCSFCNHLAENFMRTKSKYLKGMLNLTLFLLVFRHNLQKFNFTTWSEILQVYFFFRLFLPLSYRKKKAEILHFWKYNLVLKREVTMNDKFQKQQGKSLSV